MQNNNPFWYLIASKPKGFLNFKPILRAENIFKKAISFTILINSGFDFYTFDLSFEIVKALRNF
jgi:hypothetical protein